KDRFVRNPFILAFGIERAKAAAVGENGPGALRRFAARFPAKDDLARNPRICLNMSDLKPNGNDVFDRPGVDVHRSDAGRPGTHVARAEVFLDLGVRGKMLGGGFAANAEIDPFLAAIESHVAAGSELERRSAANALICVGRL